MARHEVMISNKYAKQCEICEKPVAVGEGYAFLDKDGDGKWHTAHCGCYDQKYDPDSPANDIPDDLPF